MAKEKFTVRSALAAIQAAFVLAEIPCDSYPTPEGWDREIPENRRVLARALEALSFLRDNPCTKCGHPNMSTCNACGESY